MVLTNAHHFLTMCTWDALSVNANRMKQSLNSIRRCLSHVFLLEQQKLPRVAETSSTNGSVVLRRGGTCSKMCWTKLWVGKQESSATLQSLASLFGWSSTQAGWTGVSWRIVSSLLTTCPEMIVLDTNWTTWHLVVSEQGCKISLEMDSGMWQTISKSDFLHSSHERLSSILSCEDHGTARQTGFVPRHSDSVGDFEDSQSTSGGVLCFFWKSNFCPSLLDVQGTNFGFAHLYRIWSHFSGCWTTYVWVTSSWSLGHSDWSFTFNQRQNSSHTFWPPGNWGSSWFQNQEPTCHKKQKVDQLSEVDHLPTNTHSSQGESQLYIFLKTMKLWSKWSSKT